jgi:hypothetical protein
MAHRLWPVAVRWKPSICPWKYAKQAFSFPYLSIFNPFRVEYHAEWHQHLATPGVELERQDSMIRSLKPNPGVKTQ